MRRSYSGHGLSMSHKRRCISPVNVFSKRRIACIITRVQLGRESAARVRARAAAGSGAAGTAVVPCIGGFCVGVLLVVYNNAVVFFY